MKQLRKTVSYVLIFSITFLFGWESASYYILKKTGERPVSQAQVSPMAAFSSLIVPDNLQQADMTVFWNIWDLLEKDFIHEETLDNQKMVYGAVKGMVEALDDPYTSFMDPAETTEFDQNLNGTLTGIGTELTVKDQSLTVVTPLKDSPAEKAGIMSGDVIYKIDGNLASEMSWFEAVMGIRGEKGTTVVLTIIREGTDDPFEVSIVRDNVSIESVTMEDEGEGIYLLNIYQFNDKTLLEFQEKVNELLLNEPKGLILDLRNNGGGYLEISVDIVSAFIVGQKEVVTIKRRDESDNETMYVNGSHLLANIPMVVLINEGSASASEIVAGALQDHKRALIMGETSFGKGSVQEVSKLSDGSSIRMTIAKWYTPNGNNIDEIGITPDIEVSYTEEDYQNGTDPQLAAANEYLKNLESSVE